MDLQTFDHRLIFLLVGLKNELLSIELADELVDDEHSNWNAKRLGLSEEQFGLVSRLVDIRLDKADNNTSSLIENLSSSSTLSPRLQETIESLTQAATQAPVSVRSQKSTYSPAFADDETLGHETSGDAGASKDANSRESSSGVAIDDAWLRGLASDQPSNFELIHSHARGGLGEVFVARDRSLSRNVALKQIRESHVDSLASRRRFILEAQVTGQLEHPGIVPVYALETTKDGKPQYAMRFIEGKSLEDAICEHYSTGNSHDNLERTSRLRLLLARFVDVCQAIGYAHSKGVLHRDIKPDNIMLGEFGETLVVDWGLAKVTSRNSKSVSEETLVLPPGNAEVDGADSQIASRLIDQELIDQEFLFDSESQLHAKKAANDTGLNVPTYMPTAVGSVVGTPAFMSPEQSLGETDQLTPASDIYSLGATLYQILTGRKPFVGNAVSIVSAVSKGDFLPPRDVFPDVTRQLNAICMKAMSTDPSLRYRTAIELANDIDRYLADEPIIALPDNALDKSFRFARRNRAWTLSSIAALLLVAIAATTSVFIVNHFRKENARIAQVNARIAEEKSQLAQQERLAKEEERLAKEAEKAARQDAMGQSKLAYQTLGGVIENVQSSLSDIPASSEIRWRLLKTALNGLEEISGAYSKSSDLTNDNIDRKRALAFQALSKIALQTGTGGDDDETPLEFARRAAIEALAITEKNLIPRPQNWMANRDLMISLDQLAAVENAELNYEEAEALTRRSLVLAEQMLELHPDEFKAINDLTLTLNSLAAIQRRRGNLEDAAESLQRAMDLSFALAKGKPKTDPAWRTYSYATDEYGRTLIEMEEYELAIEVLHESLEGVQGYRTSAPESRLYRDDLIASLSTLGDAYWHNGEPDKALPLFAEAAELSRTALDDEPSNESLKDDLATMLERMAGIYNVERDYELAKPLYFEALAIHERTLLLDPARTAILHKTIALNIQVADVYLSLDQTLEAIHYFERAEELALPTLDDNRTPKKTLDNLDHAQRRLKELAGD